MNPTRVFFIREGTWGDVSQKERSRCLNAQIRLLKQLAVVDSETETARRVTAIHVIDTVEDARGMMMEYRPDILLFNSCGMEEAARQMQDDYPEVRVVIQSELIPKGEIVRLNRTWLAEGDMLRAVFGGGW